ncbi:MAG: RNase J family beta-CASP ribonuclease, partial [Bacillota bacterium]|nr:RNase J family beta-CASP ribonuclease [Bacillota bacterium]
MNENKLKIIPLGGLQEIGKNMTVYEYKNEIIIVDCGIAFPEDELPGVDVVIADTTYLKQNIDKIKGLFITHSHEDHIGAIPFFLRDFDVPIYSSRFTLGIIRSKLKNEKPVMHEISPGEKVKLGSFEIEVLRVNHSTPDAFAFAIKTPLGIVVQTGDFKIDHNPIDGKRMDLVRFAELGKQGVLLLLSDSTNAVKSGYTMSESLVGETFEEIFRHERTARILIASFASNVHRIQQIINSAVKYGRKIAFAGKGMVNTSNVAMNLGYLHAPDNVVINVDNIHQYPDHELVIVTTGSQGEPMSALTRIANNEHRNVFIREGDLVIFSSSAITGNEKSVYKLVNQLMRLGAKVIFEALEEVHVSGHAKKEELKTMISLTNPKYFMPVHGEYIHLDRHREIAKGMGVPEENIFMLENGSVLEITKKGARINGSVEAGRVFIDGRGTSDIDTAVIRERKYLAEEGLLVVSMGLCKETGEVVTSPQITTRGFLFPADHDEAKTEVKIKIEEELMRYDPKSPKDAHYLRVRLKDTIEGMVRKRFKKTPMVIVLTVEVDGMSLSRQGSEAKPERSDEKSVPDLDVDAFKVPESIRAEALSMLLEQLQKCRAQKKGNKNLSKSHTAATKNSYFKIIEIGTAHGFSSISMAKCGADIRVTSFELSEERAGTATAHVLQSGMAKRIEIVNDDVAKRLPLLEDNSYDFAFLDGPKAQYRKHFDE